jgi:ketosteroid isomerase-like protein
MQFRTPVAPAVVSLVGVVLVAACGRVPPADPAFSAADEASIRQASSAYVQAVLARDVEAWGNFIASDAVYMRPNAPVEEGRAGMLQAAPARWETTALTALVYTIHEVVGRGDLAVVRGSYSTTREPAGSEPIGDRGKYLEVWQKQSDGTWKLSSRIYNTDLTSS